MFILSNIPEVQRQQLANLMEESEKALAELTSPIIVESDYNYIIGFYDSRCNEGDYQPPRSRYAKLGNSNSTSLDFN